MSYSDRFPEMVGVQDTHYDGCYKNHPECSYLVGVDDERQRIADELEKLRDRQRAREWSLELLEVEKP